MFSDKKAKDHDQASRKREISNAEAQSIEKSSVTSLRKYSGSRGALNPENVLQLQRTVGNRAVAQFLSETPNGSAVQQSSERAGSHNDHVPSLADTVAQAALPPSPQRSIDNISQYNQASVIQRMPVSYAVPGNAVLTADKRGRWMIVQGMKDVGYPQWHLTIYPKNQEEWRGNFALPAKGNRGIANWMEYDEFHITSPGSEKHFFYNENLVPLRGSSESSGMSPNWQDPDWQVANKIVTNWFRGGDPSVLKWLQDYVLQRPHEERRELAEQKAQDQYDQDFWTLYKNLYKARVGRFASGSPPEFEAWKAEIEAAYQGDRESLRQQISKEAEESARIYVQQSPLKQDETGVQGHEWSSIWVKGGTL